MPSAAASPAGSSITYFAVPPSRGIEASGSVGETTGTLAKTLRTLPSGPTKIMSSGTKVSFIQKFTISSASKTKIMPVCGGNAVRSISPRSRCAGVRATSSRRSAFGAPMVISASAATTKLNRSASDERVAIEHLDVVPIPAGLERHFQRYRQRDRAFHVRAQDAGDLVALRCEHLENELVVNLQEHRRVEARAGERALDADHRELHEIRGAALQRGVGRLALRRRAQHVVSRRQAGHVPPAAQDRRHESVAAPFLD